MTTGRYPVTENSSSSGRKPTGVYHGGPPAHEASALFHDTPASAERATGPERQVRVTGTGDSATILGHAAPRRPHHGLQVGLGDGGPRRRHPRRSRRALRGQGPLGPPHAGCALRVRAVGRAAGGRGGSPPGRGGPPPRGGGRRRRP